MGAVPEPYWQQDLYLIPDVPGEDGNHSLACLAGYVIKT
jgi:hypothetical protein